MYPYQNTVGDKALASELDVERYKKYDLNNVHELIDETGAWAVDGHKKVAALYEQSGPYPGRCSDGKDY